MGYLDSLRTGGIVILLLAGCLINDAVYEQRKNELTDHDGDGFIFEADCDDGDAGVFPGAVEVCNATDDDCNGQVDDDASDVTAWFEDTDGDGHGSLATKVYGCDADPGFVPLDDDCDDLAAGTYPGATDAWYDGVDSNCDGANDFDADQDGDDALAYGGTDCNDENALIAGTLAEGWYDGGIDNNCDGSIEDQAVAALDDVAVRIDGRLENGAFGSTILALPAGWADDEAVLLAAEPYGGVGTVYGWRASSLSDAPMISNAEWEVTGEVEWDGTGYGMGWAGNADNPLVAIARHGWGEGHGRVDVWDGRTLGEDATFSIVGETAETYLGVNVLSGHDHDGDGVHDVVASAPTDSRGATNAGAVFVFLDAGGLRGEVGVEGADLVFSNQYAGSAMVPIRIGDATDDGLHDLAFYLNLTFEEGPGALLVAGGDPFGVYDVEAASFAQLYAAGHAMAAVRDFDGDGGGELLVADGGVGRYNLPLSGYVTPWDNAESRLLFADTAYSVSAVSSDVNGYVGHSAILLMGANYEGSRGFLSVERPYWDESAAVDDATFVAIGEAAGDYFGGTLGTIDIDGDAVVDLTVGASGTDFVAPGSGSVYVVRGPE